MQGSIIMNNTPTPYELARDKYRILGIDTDYAINTVSNMRLSLLCPKANNEYLLAALSKAFKYIPSSKKISLSAYHADDDGFEPRSFQKWVDFARDTGSGIDLNIPCSATQNDVSRAIKYRKLGEYFGKALSVKTITTYIFPPFDGRAVNPISSAADICSALDKVFSETIPPAFMLDTLASYRSTDTILSCYALKNNKAVSIFADEKAMSLIPSYMLFTDELSLIFKNSQYAEEIAKTLVRSSLLGRVHITIAPEDISQGITSAWISLSRAVLKAFMKAMLEPSEALKKFEKTNDKMSVYVINEELESYPFRQIWDQLLAQTSVPSLWLKDIKSFESGFKYEQQ